MNELEFFTAAREIADPQQRAEYLEQACADDPALRDRIERLLANADGSEGFLLSPVADHPLAATVDVEIIEREGDQIGPYKLLQLLGEGGMGVVYMAEQKEPVIRRVAVKIIKPGMDTRHVIARFEAERQALAMMDHPHIAKVLDAGQTNSGRPYFAMELVNGIAVTEYCDQQHLTPQERLELFVPICQAVQHAHQKGIIHRDLKPSNILVALYDGQAVPKIIDFGVAKATHQMLTETTMFTQPGQVVGTLEYMSPEQSEPNQLDIDTRSDIYSLGVVLYELLTGETPFDRQRLRSVAFDEMLRIIREEEPSKPSAKVSGSDSLPAIAAHRHTQPRKLTALVRGELDWIVMKALEKDRARRYDTASKFAEDVQNYLNGQPVLACPPSTVYRLRKFVRRNKALLTTSAVVTTALVMGMAGMTWQADRAARFSRRELIAQVNLNFELERRAREQASINERISQALADVDSLRGRISNDGDFWNAELWTQIRAKASEALALSENDNADRSRVVRVAALVAELENEEADRRLVSQLEDARLAAMGINDNTQLYDERRALPFYVGAYAAYGLNPDQQSVEQAVAFLQKRIAGQPAYLRDTILAGLDHWNQVEGKAIKAGHGSRQRRAWVKEVVRQADSNSWRRRLRDALAEGDVDVLVELSNSPTLSEQPAYSLISLGHNLRVAAGMETEGLQSLSMAQRLYPDDFWANLEMAGAHNNSRPPRYGESLRYLSACVAVRPDNAGAHLNLGFALHQLGRLNDAEFEFKRAIELKPDYSVAWINLGLNSYRQGDFDAAIEHLEHAVEANPDFVPAQRLLGNLLLSRDLPRAARVLQSVVEQDPQDAIAWNLLGVAWKDQGQPAKAIEAYRESIRLNPKEPAVHTNLGLVLQEQGELDEAINEHQQALILRPRYALASTNLGEALRQHGKLDQAIQAYDDAIKANPKYFSAHRGMYMALYEAGKSAEAIAACRRAVDLEPEDAVTLGNLGFFLLQQGELDEALTWLQKARDVTPNDPFVLNTLGEYHQQRGELSEAIQFFQQALDNRSGYEAAQANLNAAHQQQELAARLQRVLAEEIEPANADEALSFARLCCQTDQYEAALRLYRVAFQSDPDIADDLASGHRYQAACVAALHAGSQSASDGEDKRGSPWRQQAVQWLAADLALWADILTGDDRKLIEQLKTTLTHWKQDPDLNALRDASRLAELPDTERVQYEQLWTRVDSLLSEADRTLMFKSANNEFFDN